VRWIVASTTWGQDLAQVYDSTYAAMFEPAVLEPTVDLLAELAVGARRSSSPSAPDA
jgi:hypothetical protein